VIPRLDFPTNRKSNAKTPGRQGAKGLRIRRKFFLPGSLGDEVLISNRQSEIANSAAPASRRTSVSSVGFSLLALVLECQ